MPRDRYGRRVAFAFAGNTRQSLEQALLAAGAAQVAARVGDRACAETLLAAEREARAGHRGLWADPNFAPLAADNFARLAAEIGHFPWWRVIPNRVTRDPHATLRSVCNDPSRYLI
jgi:endonuclease YncB( thermonuclease family)